MFSSVYQDFFYGYQGQALVFRSISVYQLVVIWARNPNPNPNHFRDILVIKLIFGHVVPY